MGDRTAKISHQEMCMTESQFADDAALYTNTREEMDQVAMEFVRTAAEWGLTVSIEKTKLLAVGKDMRPEDSRPLQLDEGENLLRQPIFPLVIPLPKMDCFSM